MASEVTEKLLSRLVRTPSGCWEWTGGKMGTGYGNIRVQGKTQTTHRLAYHLFCGPIPPGLHVLHSCDNPPCCNPTHLRTGTDADNVADRIARGRQHRGERTGTSLLTTGQVEAIRRLAAEGTKHKELAERFGVTREYVSQLVSGKRWKHLPLHPSRTERAAAGQRTASAVLTADAVRAIRSARSEGLGYKRLSSRFGVPVRTIRCIVNGRSWRHVS